MMALNKKLLRDLFRLRGQVTAISLIIASGAANLVMSVSAIEILEESGQAYYERHRFADVFAHVTRAPERLAQRIAKIDGVQTVETRIAQMATLDVPGFDEPVLGQLISRPDQGKPKLNLLALREGRWLAAGRTDEALINEPFAEAHGLKPGDTFHAILNGQKRPLKIVGIVLSPEFVYTIGPGALMPDNKRYGIIWMGRDALAAAYDQKGAFNSLTLSLLRGATAETVLAELDILLAPYGGTGAILRKDQISNWFLQNEIVQQRNMSSVLPTIFLVAAAFLTNMVLARLIAMDRDEIGLLKAFGYSNWDVGWFYLKLAAAMTVPGILLGWVLGFGLATWMAQMYGEYFRFPFLLTRPSVSVFAISALVSMGAALIGTLSAVRRAIVLPPADAMRPPAPTAYRRATRLGALIAANFDQPTRMIFRYVLRWPVRSALSATGMGLGVAVLIMAFFWQDSIAHMINVYFFDAQKQNITIAFNEARRKTVLSDVKRLPGALMAEPERFVGVRFIAGTKTHRGSLQGVLPQAHLSQVYDANKHALEVPRGGLVLSTMLAKVLNVDIGDTVTVEVLEGRRPVLDLPVTRLFETYLGTPAYMHLDALGRALKEVDTVNLVHMLVDQNQSQVLFKELRNNPAIAAVMRRDAAVTTFRQTMDETVLMFIAFFTAFAAALTFGTVYNGARISLSERERELATLRVLGAGRAYISYVLLGEVALLTVVGLPLGCLIGFLLSGFMASAFETELFRIPFVIAPVSYGYAVTIGLVVTVVSALWVRRNLDRLDLIAVLKTRD